MAITVHSEETTGTQTQNTGNWLSNAEIAAWADIPVSVAVDLIPEGQIDPALALRTRLPAGQEARLSLRGRALTVQCNPPDFGAVVLALDQVQAGDVVVVAAQARTDFAMIGEILGGHLRAKGCAGLVVDGAVRDIDQLGSWPDFPVFARGINPRGPTSAAGGALFGGIDVGGCPVNAGDLILGDADGLIVLDADLARAHLDAAKAKIGLEQRWIAALASGKAAGDVFGL
ncbi:MAG: dimethylmenaquinone methyltransferase [Kiloniella sp.]|nr:dimethylmenaquinone methyltransferase [Kiloniella sp.]